MQTANRVKCVLAVTGLLVCFDLFALSLTAADTRDVIKIMPLGDSITAGDLDGGYRRLLYDLLTQDGIRFAFVGSLTGGRVPDARHEGHSGWRIDQIEDGIAGGWLETYKPDLVLLHIGTNDIWQNKGANAPARLSWLIDDILSRLPSTRVIVAQILPMTNGASFEAEVMHYNAAIAELVTSKTSRVCMVNLHEVLSAADFVDGVHPKKSGLRQNGADMGTSYSGRDRRRGSCRRGLPLWPRTLAHFLPHAASEQTGGVRANRRTPAGIVGLITFREPTRLIGFRPAAPTILR